LQRKHLTNTTGAKEITEDKDDKLQSSFFFIKFKKWILKKDTYESSKNI
jgi:hypothetical protein